MALYIPKRILPSEEIVAVAISGMNRSQSLGVTEVCIHVGPLFLLKKYQKYQKWFSCIQKWKFSISFQ